MTMTEKIRGEVNQLLTPEEANNYHVGTVGHLFAGHGWHIVVIDSDEESTTMDSLRTMWPSSCPSYIYDVVAFEPDFSEGDTVEIEVEQLNERWHAHPEVPI